MSAPNNFSHLPNLSSLVLGAQIVFATDEWFAEGGFISSFASCTSLIMQHSPRLLISPPPLLHLPITHKTMIMHIRITIVSYATHYAHTSSVSICSIYSTGENLLKSDEPVWDETKFTVYGKWMDGWESRRKRTEGYDWCIIKLNIPGDIHSIELDTCHFTGNYSPMASVQACYLDEDSVSCLAAQLQ